MVLVQGRGVTGKRATGRPDRDEVGRNEAGGSMDQTPDLAETLRAGTR